MLKVDVSLNNLIRIVCHLGFLFKYNDHSIEKQADRHMGRSKFECGLASVCFG